MYVECSPKLTHTFRSPYDKKTLHDINRVLGRLVSISLSSFIFPLPNPLLMLSYSVLPNPTNAYVTKKGRGHVFSQIVPT